MRLQAIADIGQEDLEASQEALVRLACDDADILVRQAAIDRVNSADALAALLADQAVANHAAKAMAALIEAGQPCASADHPLVVEARVGIASPASVGELVNAVTDPEQAAELAIHCAPPDREPVFAMPCLRTAAGLATLEKRSRGRDKACNRYARERLDSLKSARNDLQSAQDRLVELDASIRKELNHHPQDASALVVHRQKLGTLKTMRDGAMADVNTAAALIGAITDEPVKTLIPDDPLAGTDLTVPDPANNPFVPLVAALQQLAGDMRDGVDRAKIAESRDALTRSWLASADSQPPTQAQHEVFNAVSRQYQDLRDAEERFAALAVPDAPAALPPNMDQIPAKPLLDKRTRWQKTIAGATRKLAWPMDHRLPPAFAAAAAQTDRVWAEIEQLRALEQSRDALVERCTHELKECVDQGRIAEARTHLRQIRQLQKLGVRGAEHDINALATRLDELKDWQSFATHPKRDELLRTIEALATDPIAPPDQAIRLREIRQAWIQLGPPTNPAETRAQHAFDRFADEAFKTCKVYYEEQNALRSRNLDARKALCDDLRGYIDATDWSNADMKAAETIMRQAREEWRRFHPCERKLLKPVEQQFEALQAELHDKVKSSWENNIAQKRRLVDRAKTLLETDDIQGSIEQAKALQREWRDVGATPRGADQRLWREFRKICDDIFGRREEHAKAQTQARKEQRTLLEDRVKALQDLLANDPAASQSDLNALLDEVHAASRELTVERQMVQHINALETSIRRHVADQRRVQARTQLFSFREWDIAVSDAEQKAQPIEAPDPIFAARLNGQPNQEDLAALTLEAEIAADLPSPPAEQARRMALQIDLMNRGIRSFDHISNKDYLKRWCGCGPKDASANELRERFFNALASRLASE